MSSLKRYSRRLLAGRDAGRDQWLRKTQAFIQHKLPNSLSYHHVTIDGVERACAVLSTQNDVEKKICSMPGETFVCGAYVEWADNVWMITSLNAPSEVYQTAVMTQCNYELKWINDYGKLITRWCVANDGTKYLTGEYFQDTMTVGDSRIQLYIPRDSETVHLGRGKRFLLDDPESENPMAFKLTKPNRVSNVYNGHGYFIHMLEETNTTEYDNVPLMIADYYLAMEAFRLEFDGEQDGVITVRSNSTQKIVARVEKEGKVIPADGIVYTSSNPAVAVISEDGALTKCGIGTCTIRADYGVFYKDVTLNVVSDEAENVMLVLNAADGDDGAIMFGAEKTIKAQVSQGGTIVRDAPCVFSIDCDAKIATLQPDGSTCKIVCGGNRKYIGEVITLYAHSDEIGVDAKLKLEIRGWT